MGNRFTSIDENIKKYLMDQYLQYEEKKLTLREEVQFFQDLLDTGLIYSMSDQMRFHMTMLIEADIVLTKKEPVYN